MPATRLGRPPFLGRAPPAEILRDEYAEERPIERVAHVDRLIEGLQEQTARADAGLARSTAQTPAAGRLFVRLGQRRIWVHRGLPARVLEGSLCARATRRIRACWHRLVARSARALRDVRPSHHGRGCGALGTKTEQGVEMPEQIVVGVDGSEAAEKALIWAAETASRDGAH